MLDCDVSFLLADFFPFGGAWSKRHTRLCAKTESSYACELIFVMSARFYHVTRAR